MTTNEQILAQRQHRNGNGNVTSGQQQVFLHIIRNRVVNSLNGM
jgi:hypothetical protein